MPLVSRGEELLLIIRICGREVRIVPFTYEDAKRMVGDSTDWKIGLEASLKKWEQIEAGDSETYDIATRCGLCFVAYNRAESCLCCCPAEDICDNGNIHSLTPREVLRRLREIDLEEGW